MILTYLIGLIIGFILLGVFDKNMSHDEYAVYVIGIFLWPPMIFFGVCGVVAICPFLALTWIGHQIRILVEKE